MLGSDHSVKTDADGFKDMSFWLTLLHRADKRLNGIIHLYLIHNTRIPGTSLRDSRIFWALCGEDDLSNVILIMFFWDRVDAGEGRRREAELAQIDRSRVVCCCKEPEWKDFKAKILPFRLS
jgi:hypothetical protein